MSPERIRHRLKSLPRWSYDELTEGLMRFDLLPDAETAARWAAKVVRRAQHLGRFPVVEIEGAGVRIQVRPREGALAPGDVLFARELDEALEREDMDGKLAAVPTEGLRPEPRRPTATSLARVLAAAEGGQVLPEALWLLKCSVPIPREAKVLDELTRIEIARSWREVSWLLDQLDRLVRTRRRWVHPSAVLHPPYPPLHDLLLACGLRLESSTHEERAALAKVGERLEVMVDLERKVEARKAAES